MTQSPLPAGEFSTWLAEFARALKGEQASTVPCGTCTACCSSSQFVHVDPDETDTLRHIPAALLFAAPGLPDGHLVMGYDENGRCPMLGDHGCSIYDHRPRTCRTYDCRVLAAAGVEIDPAAEPHKAAIGAQARRWRFTYATPEAEAAHDAARARARHDLEDKPPHTVTAVAISSVLVGQTHQK